MILCPQLMWFTRLNQDAMVIDLQSTAGKDILVKCEQLVAG